MAVLQAPLLITLVIIRMLVFSRRAMRLRPVHSIKHVVDIQNALVVGTANSEVLIIAEDAPVLADTNEVETASTVNAIYLNVRAYATTEAALANLYMIVYKDPGGNLSAIAPNAVGSSDDKRFVIHQHMVMLGGSTTEIPVTVFDGVIRIPRGYKRFGIKDRLLVRLLAPGVVVDYCVQCIYKEFR